LKNLASEHLQTGVEEVLEDVVDLEEYARLGKRPPLSKGYRIKVNGEPFVVPEPEITGRQVLSLAGLLPAENYTLRVKIAGEKPRKVELDEKVNLRHPGIEKFKALPKDQTEGA
jgi:Multiubiquitin